MVKFLWGVRLSFEMVVILTISQKSPGILAIMITIDTVDGKTIYGLCALSDHRSPEQRKPHHGLFVISISPLLASTTISMSIETVTNPRILTSFGHNQIFPVLLFSAVANSRLHICGNRGVSHPVLMSCTSSEPFMMPLSFGIF